MRKKDYELIAGAIATCANNADFEHQPIIDEVARYIADEFVKAGYKFDRQKFLTACGIEPYILAGKVVRDNFGKGKIVYKH